MPSANFTRIFRMSLHTLHIVQGLSHQRERLFGKSDRPVVCSLRSGHERLMLCMTPVCPRHHHRCQQTSSYSPTGEFKSQTVTCRSDQRLHSRTLWRWLDTFERGSHHVLVFGDPDAQASQCSLLGLGRSNVSRCSCHFCNLGALAPMTFRSDPSPV